MPLKYYNEELGFYCTNIPNDESTIDKDVACSSHRPRIFITECNSKCAYHTMCKKPCGTIRHDGKGPSKLCRKFRKKITYWHALTSVCNMCFVW